MKGRMKVEDVVAYLKVVNTIPNKMFNSQKIRRGWYAQVEKIALEHLAGFVDFDGLLVEPTKSTRAPFHQYLKRNELLGLRGLVTKDLDRFSSAKTSEQQYVRDNFGTNSEWLDESCQLKPRGKSGRYDLIWQVRPRGLLVDVSFDPHFSMDTFSCVQEQSYLIGDFWEGGEGDSVADLPSKFLKDHSIPKKVTARIVCPGLNCHPVSVNVYSTVVSYVFLANQQLASMRAAKQY